MWSPFGSIKSWFSEVLGIARRGVAALESILETIKALVETAERFEAPQSAQLLQTDDIRITEMAKRIDDLTLAVSEGVNNVQRSERRVRAVVRSAKKELADAGFEHTGLEAEDSELREVDGSERDAEPLREVQESLALTEDSAIPGVTVRQLQIARARRR